MGEPEDTVAPAEDTGAVVAESGEAGENAPDGDNGDDGESGAASRRKFLVGGAAVAGAAAFVAGGSIALLRRKDESTTDIVTATRVANVPVDDPDSGVWGKAEKAKILMDGQAMAQPTRPKPSVKTINVRALYDAEKIGFRLEWSDPVDDDLTIRVDGFRDAAAVLLSYGAADEAVRIMGTPTAPATILHWKADWQRDVDRGFQDVEVEFPNMTVDFYPPIVPFEGTAEIPESYEKADATQWLPGMHVGNPLSQPDKTSPVEKAKATGFGTLATQPTQNAVGRGVWKDGTWKVVLAKPLAAADPDEVALKAGWDYGMAVAVWSGKEWDRGGQKSPSKLLLTLRLEA